MEHLTLVDWKDSYLQLSVGPKDPKNIFSKDYTSIYDFKKRKKKSHKAQGHLARVCA